MIYPCRLFENLLGHGDWKTRLVFTPINPLVQLLLTSATSVVRLNVCLGDLAILHLESISLTAHTTEDSVSLKTEVQGLGKLAGWVTKESDLEIDWVRQAQIKPLGRVVNIEVDLLRSAWRGRAARSMPSCCDGS